MKRFPPILWLVCLVCIACSDSDEQPVEQPVRDAIFLFTSTSGVGDNGYNDMILNATSAFAYGHDLDLYIIQSATVGEAEVQYKLMAELLDAEAAGRMLILLASSEYAAIASTLPQPGEGGSVLLLESDGQQVPEWMATAKLNRYGAGYLTGAMVSDQPAELIMAMPGEPLTEEAAAGFEAGFAAHADGKPVTRHYLSEGYQGFNMQVAARKLTSSIMKSYQTEEIPYCTFYPLAGGSNLGVYNAFTDYFHVQQAIGMDIDCNDQNDYIPFSVVLHMDNLVQHCLELWYDKERELALRSSYGLDSEFVEITFSQSWDPMGIFAAWCDPTATELPRDFWNNNYLRYLAEAINKEKAYENQ